MQEITKEISQQTKEKQPKAVGAAVVYRCEFVSKSEVVDDITLPECSVPVVSMRTYEMLALHNQ